MNYYLGHVRGLTSFEQVCKGSVFQHHRPHCSVWRGKQSVQPHVQNHREQQTNITDSPGKFLCLCYYCQRKKYSGIVLCTRYMPMMLGNSDVYFSPSGPFRYSANEGYAREG